MFIPTFPKLASLDLIPDTGFYQVAGKYLVQAAGRPNEFTQPWQAVVQGYGMYVFKNLEPIGLAVIAGGRRYWAPITCEDPRAPARGELVEVPSDGPFLPPAEDGQ